MIKERTVVTGQGGLGAAMGVDRRTALAWAGSASLMGLGGRAWAAPAGFCFTETRHGKLRGRRAGGVDGYRGVPYAGSVSGANRFRAAPPAPSWSGVRDALRLGPPSIQAAGGTYGLNEPSPAEDCLFLNIWAPSGGGHGKPVMVYSHGGGFTSGSGGSVSADGTNLAREQDVVVVSTNHRLGLLGYIFLDELAGAEYTGSANRGVEDIAAALKWISENIAAFGGDPHNVMLFGESGGAMKSCCLYAMPAAAPYFHKASMESGPGIRMTERDVAAATTRKLLEHLGLAPADWRQLLAMPAARLLEAQIALGKVPNSTPDTGWPGRKGLGAQAVGGFGPVVDGHVLPRHPFDPDAPAISRSKPLMVGGNEDEQGFFSSQAKDTAAFQLDEAALMGRLAPVLDADAASVVALYRRDRPGASPTDIFIAIQSDLFSGQGSTVIAERKARQGGTSVYRYVFAFDQGTPVAGTDYRMGAMHALDIPFKFDIMDAPIGAGAGWLAGNRPERYAAGRNMSAMWAAFARTGHPAAPGQPAWPAYSLERREVMYIDAQCRVETDPYAAERQYWEAKA